MVNSQVKRRDKSPRKGFNYRPTDPKKLKARAEASGGDFETYFKQGVDLYKTRNGENLLRIMPPTFKDAEHFGYEFWAHSFVGPDRSSFLCLKKMKNKPCRCCELERELREDAGNAKEAEEADKLKPKKKVIYWIRDRNGEIDDPVIWQASSAMDKEISGRCEKRSGKILHLDNPWEGHDVSFRKTGQMLATRYTKVDVDSDETPLADSKKEINRLLEFIEEHPLDEQLKYHTYDQMAAALDGGAPEKDEALDDDEDDDDRKSSKKSKRRVAARDEDDGDEDDEDDEGEDKHGNVTSKRKRRSRDEDEDDEEEDDDEDEKPKRRGRVAPKDDDEDDADEDDDEDEDDKPAKKRRRPAADDDEDEDDDDEDEKPARRGKRTARDDDDDEDDDKPAKRRARRDPEEDDEDEVPSSRRARRR